MNASATDLEVDRVLDDLRATRALLPLLADQLLASLPARAADPRLRSRLASEVVLRAWLRAAEEPVQPMEDFANRLRGLCPEGAVEALWRWLGDQRCGRSFASPPELAVAAPLLHEELAGALRAWQQADGMVFFVPPSPDPSLAPAMALPFFVETVAVVPGRLARTADDEPLPGLENGVREASLAAQQLGLLRRNELAGVVFPTLRGCAPHSLAGRSLGLPVLLALAFRHRGLRPDPFSWGAAGEVLSHGCIGAAAPVPVVAKQRLLTRMAIPRTAFSGVGKFAPDQALGPAVADFVGSVATRPLEPALSLGDEVQVLTRRLRAGKATPAATIVRLHQLLDGPLAAPTDARGRQARTEAVVALAAAACHTGNPEAAATLSLSATGDGSGQRHEAAALVRLAVACTDLGCFAQAEETASRALALALDAARLDEVTGHFLALRAFGTRGQARAFRALAELGLDAGPAREDLESAIAHARELEIPGAGESELPRCLAGRALWLALFQPAEALPECGAQLASLPPDSPEAMHLLRHRWLAVDRARRQGVELKWRDYADTLPPTRPGSLWVRALALKYRACVRRAAGESAATTDFAEAIDLLAAEHATPLNRFLLATVELAAAESAHGANGTHLDRAAALFAQMPPAFRGPWQPAPWLAHIAALRASEPTLTDPHLSLPY